jgi:MerR family transcriptional regulator/heat shock protein HspR
MLDDTRPLYSIGMAAELLDVHPRTLRLYEQGGLLRPARRNNRRVYSNNDLKWIQAIRYMIHERGLNQEGLRRLLALIPCWKITGCPSESWKGCPAYENQSDTCWQIAGEACDQSKECSQCEVYLSARERICRKEELEAIEAFEI